MGAGLPDIWFKLARVRLPDVSANRVRLPGISTARVRLPDVWFELARVRPPDVSANRVRLPDGYAGTTSLRGGPARATGIVFDARVRVGAGFPDS